MISLRLLVTRKRKTTTKSDEPGGFTHNGPFLIGCLALANCTVNAQTFVRISERDILSLVFFIKKIQIKKYSIKGLHRRSDKN